MQQLRERAGIGRRRHGVPLAEPDDPLVDVWAFGCLLYECLSGTRAFSGETIPDVLSAVIGDEPGWSRLPPRTPAHVRELLARCLEKEPARRLRDVGDAGLMLLAVPALPDVGQRGDAGGSKATLVVVALGAAAVAAAVTALVLSDGPAVAPPPVTHLAVPQPDRIWPGAGRGSSLTFAVSADGQSIARWSVVPGPRGGESVIAVWDRATGRRRSSPAWGRWWGIRSSRRTADGSPTRPSRT